MIIETVWPTTMYWLGSGDGESVWDKPEMLKNKTTDIVWLTHEDEAEEESE